MVISMRDIGGSDVLAGALNGSTALTNLLSATNKEPETPEPLFIDFLEVEVATASFLRESVLAFRDQVRKRRSRLYPVIANANEAVRDELIELTRARGEVLMICTLGEDEVPQQVTRIGDLDDKQKMTLELVQERGETDAGELMRAYGESEGLKHTTAWNNRLAALAMRGLIVEVSRGRAKRYRPIFGST